MTEQTNIKKSPFSDNRWETDYPHLIWLPPQFSKWEGKKSVYITGSRGTGKTTLLRAFEWNERITNVSLQQQFDDPQKPFASHYIGIYLNIPDVVSKNFKFLTRRTQNIKDRRIIEEIELENAAFFSLYLEYQLLQLSITAIRNLRSKGYLKYRPEDELTAVKEILQERKEIKDFLFNKFDSPKLNDIRLAFKEMHEEIYKNIQEKTKLYPENGKSYTFPPLEIGVVLDQITSILLDLCSVKDLPWSLKVCIDSSESMLDWQQRTINTMVARPKGNISFAVASMTDFDANSTYLLDHPLKDDDRYFVNLDDEFERNQTTFAKFVTEVTNLRLQNHYQDNTINADLRHILGIYSINNQLNRIIKESKNPNVMDFRQKTAKFQISWKNLKNNFKKRYPQEYSKLFEDTDEFDDNVFEDSVDLLPYTQAYLVEKLNIKIPGAEDEKEFNRLMGGTFKKKNIAASLCLCNEYSLKRPYAGYKMVLMMSDNCIRDFLRQMDAIFIELGYPKEKEDFLNKKINPEIQRIAIEIASEIKFGEILEKTPYYQQQAYNLINALGKITTALQSANENISSLNTPERGLFRINYSGLNPEIKEKLNDIIGSTKSYYYIKKIEESTVTQNSSDYVTIRVHRLFAPKFKFSYRGAYYPFSMSPRTLLKLCDEKDPQTLNSIIDSIMKPEKNATLDKWIDSNE